LLDESLNITPSFFSKKYVGSFNEIIKEIDLPLKFTNFKDMNEIMRGLVKFMIEIFKGYG